MGDGKDVLIIGLLASLFQCLVYLIDGDRFFCDEDETSDGAGDYGNAEGYTIKEAFKFGDGFGGGNGGAGGGGNDVLGGGSGTAEVAMRVILEVLVIGVGVDGVHEGLFNSELTMDNFGYGRNAVGGTRGIGHDGFILFLIDAADVSVDEIAFGRGGNDDVMGSCIQMFLSAGSVAEDPGGFDNHVDLVLFPGKLNRVTLSKNRTLFVVD